MKVRTINCPLCGRRCPEGSLVSHPEECDVRGCPLENAAEGLRHCGCFYERIRVGKRGLWVDEAALTAGSL